jgi:branched-chain amino acid transport system permease protein
VTRDPKVVTERVMGIAALCVLFVAPLLLSNYWVDVILTQMLIVGIAAASLIFLAAYGGMISLAQTALAGTAGFILGNLVTKSGAGGETKGLALGWNPTLSLVIAIVGTTLIGLFFGAIAARSTGIYFLMITLTFSVIGFYFVGQVTVVSGFSGIGSINEYTPGFVGDMVNDRYRLYYIALGVALFAYALIRLLVRTPFGLSLQGVRDEPVRMSSLGFAVPLHRTLAFGLAAFLASLSGVLLVWWQGQIAPGDVGLPATIDLLIVAVIGGLARIEGAWVGAFAFILISNYVRDSWLTRLLGDVHIGGSFNTIIGLIFLLIVIVSPDGLVGLWDRLWARIRRGGDPDAPVVSVVPVAPVGTVPREV